MSDWLLIQDLLEEINELRNQIELGDQMKQLAEKARPIDDEDLGSERQIDAFNVFCDALERTLSADDFERFEDYAMKATTDELIDYGLMLFCEVAR